MKKLSINLAAIALVALSAVPAYADATVSVEDNSFSPETVTIDSGDTVSWHVEGLNPHNVMADGGSFASSTLSEGDDFSHTFTTPGTFAYTCTIHGSIMSGRVVVRGASSTFAPAPTDASAGGDGLAQTGSHPRRNAVTVGALTMIGLGLVARGIAARAEA